MEDSKKQLQDLDNSIKQICTSLRLINNDAHAQVCYTFYKRVIEMYQEYSGEQLNQDFWNAGDGIGSGEKGEGTREAVKKMGYQMQALYQKLFGQFFEIPT